MTSHEGIIYQAISGFYYVWSEGESFVTKPRGNFRHLKTNPLVGDRVRFVMDQQDESQVGRLEEIFERDNYLIRPSVANVDYALIVMSLIEPAFSYNLLDYFLVSMESHRIQPIILLTKYDLLIEQNGSAKSRLQVKEITDLYEKIGYQVFLFDQSEEKLKAIKTLFQEGIYVMTGQSGVGKSTLLNQLLPEAEIKTNQISNHLNRGKHTTREVTLYRFGQGLLADTPGFSAIDFDHLEKEDLAACFPEIYQAGAQCRFRSCIHKNEPNCHVKERVASGSISQSRYQNYLQILEKIENKKIYY
ncbi:ribosome small subunit-dependent GTPase A [Facklamia miroungae]|nr:ribosome small subunit-dependent GTPase A [Facklamia miroungae]NKZ28797.1 ribosome small subunit-dependent GTPase A [Facklamia miroungae]